MDQSYANSVLARLQRMKAVHAEKFADNAAHCNCMPRIDAAIARLEAEGARGEQPPRLDFSVSESALPDGLQEGTNLEHEARAMEAVGDPLAPEVHARAHEMFFKELNQLDGFDR